MPIITKSLQQAIADLQSGKPVAIPTETVYGLAALYDDENAIRAVFALKNRPLNHPLIVHVAEDFDLEQLVEEVPDYARQLIRHFWPGPLTLVMRSKKGRINPLITGNQETVAIRCPAHPLAQDLLKALKKPLVAPSANPFGKISPTTAVHVRNSFSQEELTILDGGRCQVGIESTIVDATNPQGYQLLRHGLIDENTIAATLQSKGLSRENTLRVPGRLETHYQPQKPLYYFSDPEEMAVFCQQRKGDVYVIANQKPSITPVDYYHSFASTPEEAAYELYFQLRAADESNAACIAIQLPKSESAWHGVRERIVKAGRPAQE